MIAYAIPNPRRFTETPKRICAIPHPAPSNIGMASCRKVRARYVSTRWSTKTKASIHGTIASETTLKTSHTFSHFQARTNFDGNMQVPDINPATITRNTPATTGCPINDFHPNTTSSHRTRLVPAESCSFHPQPKPGKRNDRVGAECAPGTKVRVPAQCD